MEELENIWTAEAVWTVEHIKPGLCVRRRSRRQFTATLMQASWAFGSDGLDAFILVVVEQAAYMPNVLTRAEMAAYLNEHHFFEA